MKNEHNSKPHHESESRELHPHIWIGSLADYNAGRLHGEWLDAAVDSIDLQAAVNRILASSHEPDAEEWGIFDYDDFGDFQVGEYEALDQVAAVAQGIVKYGPAFASWAEIHDGNPDMLAQFEDCFMGTYESPAAWAREVIEGSDIEVTLDREIPADLRAYIQFDYDGFAYDARLSGDIHIEDAPAGSVWIFRVI
ncbi:antirestriction protein ArdA [Rhodococcus sp. SBT000017]|uniref:antirestriction protein ArdA n=1 Tax=Rhodococcus sp. SBT000017 TaxID=1803385 RepID=UPI000EF8D4E3|nr:antirestriction protein ArdA [Rhodococcus sp. SBT000017]RMB77657.1 antirestriction protein ArdA [Rhodococcus sp. SBT000017]